MSVVGVRFHSLKTPNPHVLPLTRLAENVIDVGCGNGRNMIFKRNVGIDLDRKALQVAKEKGDVILADAQALPIKTKAFDLALLVNVLNFTEKPDLTLKEALRVSNQPPLITIYPAKKGKHKILEE